MMRLANRATAPRALLLTLFALSLGAEPASSPQADFVLDGRAIHPMSVQRLVGNLADEQPVIAGVDLEGSAQNKSNRAKMSVENGTVTAPDGGGFVAYRHVGTTPGGLHVLVVMVNGGGSGVFEDALWVKIIRDQVSEDGKQRDRTMLVRVGQFTLGDRDDGEVKLEGTKLLIGRSRYRKKDTVIQLE
jgi:hypothetical protein